MGWLRSVERLSRTAPTEQVDALRHRTALLTAASELAPYASGRHRGHDPARSGEPCPVAWCALRSHPDGAALCALVGALDAIGEGRASPVRTVVDVDALVARFTRTLADSLDAVRYCRLIEHPAGRCWFAPDGARPGCGEVLRLAHVVGGS